jgi:hypothetical protein
MAIYRDFVSRAPVYSPVSGWRRRAFTDVTTASRRGRRVLSSYSTSWGHWIEPSTAHTRSPAEAASLVTILPLPRAAPPPQDSRCCRPERPRLSLVSRACADARERGLVAIVVLNPIALGAILSVTLGGERRNARWFCGRCLERLWAGSYRACAATLFAVRCVWSASDWLRWWGEQRRQLVEWLIDSCCARAGSRPRRQCRRQARPLREVHRQRRADRPEGGRRRRHERVVRVCGSQRL